ncbi:MULTISPECIES: histidine phosphatase family protein [Gammaproteobacteria]|uniref:SixA phosphatase family protein n=1 Tax=Gammaproteobacteria TaxID=1236 RepID=UPI000DD06791|nr:MULTISPECIES: histidine phosphatase family protein [Gammaproteobacteria]RTE86913.1 histidine phosphatase family protein [Aliidiomarina sp. B3213]TCZ93297.1 histidine phosphatase family protein [Lysobacter sp. N42]
MNNQADEFHVYIIRHAEKAKSDGENRDPQLSYCGQQRARALVHLLKDRNIDAVYATGYQRTQRTARPLAQDRGLVVQEYNARDSQALVDSVLSKKEDALIVGHSNTAPVIANLMAGTELELLDESEFDKLYSIEVHTDRVLLHELNQGFVCDES